jgi:hypothetical protein
LKIGGYVEAVGYGLTPTTRKSDAVNSHAQGRVTIDARDTTEYGLLRTFVRLDYGRSSGSDDNSGSWPRRGQTIVGGSKGYGNLQTSFGGSEAYVQFGGLTAGRLVTSSFVGLSRVQWTTAGPGTGRVNEIAYTAALGNGMSITAAVEDAAEMREAVWGSNASWSTWDTTGTTIIPNNVPDGVVSFDVAQAWGTFKLAGTYHNVKPDQQTTAESSKTGYAVTGAVKINLPMISAGDNIQAFGSYGNGAVGRVLGNVMTDTNPSNGSYGFGRNTIGAYDGYVVNGVFKLATAYSFGAQLEHYFAPTVSTYVAGSYGNVSYGSGNCSTQANCAASSATGPNGGNMWTVGGGIVWSPTAGLEINPEVYYRKSTQKVGNRAAGEGVATLNSDDQVGVKIRVARSF